MQQSEMVKREDVVRYLIFIATNGPTEADAEELGVDEMGVRFAQAALLSAAKQIEMGNPCLKSFNLQRK